MLNPLAGFSEPVLRAPTSRDEVQRSCGATTGDGELFCGLLPEVLLPGKRIAMDRNSKEEERRYCPWCGGRFFHAVRDGRERLVCKACDRVFYVNPAPASAVAITSATKILLVRRKFDPYAGMWCLPAGFIEVDEHPEETAVREVYEETGLEVRIKSLHAIYSGNDDPRTTVILIVYRGEYVSGELKPGDDASEAEWFDLGATPENIAFSTHRRVIENLRRELTEG